MTQKPLCVFLLVKSYQRRGGQLLHLKQSVSRCKKPFQHNKERKVLVWPVSVLSLCQVTSLFKPHVLPEQANMRFTKIWVESVIAAWLVRQSSRNRRVSALFPRSGWVLKSPGARRWSFWGFNIKHPQTCGQKSFISNSKQRHHKIQKSFHD